MARQKHSNTMAVSILVVALVIAFSGFMLIGKTILSKSNFNKCTAFPVQSYLDGDALWNNADYAIKCSFKNILVQPKSSGSLLCSVIDDGKNLPLPIILTSEAAKHPLQPEQKVILKVRVRDDGAIVATDCVLQ